MGNTDTITGKYLCVAAMSQLNRIDIRVQIGDGRMIRVCCLMVIEHEVEQYFTEGT